MCICSDMPFIALTNNPSRQVAYVYFACQIVSVIAERIF